MPVSVIICRAKMHDSKTLVPAFDDIIIYSPCGFRRAKHLCLDKVHDLASLVAAVQQGSINLIFAGEVKMRPVALP